MAINVLNEWNQSKHVITNLMLFQNTYFGTDCLDLAVISDSKNFIANKAVQDLLSLIWFGGLPSEMFYRKVFLSICTFGIAAPCFFVKKPYYLELEEEDKNFITSGKPSYSKASLYNDLEKNFVLNPNNGNGKFTSRESYVKFYSSPAVKYITNFLWFIAFLLLSSYTLITQFSPLFTYTSITDTSVVTKISLYSVLAFWAIGILIEEINQAINEKQNYLNSIWNWIDIAALVTYFIGLSLGFGAIFATQLLTASRMIFSVSIILWYFKMLYFLLVTQKLGPKVFLIGLMVKDLFYYYIIIMIIVVGYGIAMFANMYPSQGFSFDFVKTVAATSYWSIYGEMGILDNIDNTDASCQNDSQRCATSEGSIFTFVLLMVYLAFGNVLLLNILIAMFNTTYGENEENSDQIWKSQLCTITLDYYAYPVLPVPFNVLALLGESLLNLYRRLKNNNKTIDSKACDP